MHPEHVRYVIESHHSLLVIKSKLHLLIFSHLFQQLLLYLHLKEVCVFTASICSKSLHKACWSLRLASMGKCTDSRSVVCAYVRQSVHR